MLLCYSPDHPCERPLTLLPSSGGAGDTALQTATALGATLPPLTLHLPVHNWRSSRAL